MKVAHFSVFAPNKCGLYHTAKERVLAERTAGIDARFIAFDEKGKCTDGDFETEDIKWSYRADILVRHSAIPEHIHNAGIPIVMALHGRPESSVRLEESNTIKVITSINNKAHDSRYKAYITFWPEHVDMWNLIVPREKMFYVPATVDLDEYSPKNEKHDLGKDNVSPNVLIPDIWRDDVIPFNVLFAAERFVAKNGGRVHIIGMPKKYIQAMTPFFLGMKKRGTLGYLSGQIRHIKGMYRSADIVATPHVIATRSVRESLASGIPLVAGEGCKYTPYTANSMDVDGFADAIDRCWNKPEDVSPRQVAEQEFNYQNAGKAAKSIFDAILSKNGSVRKIFIDVGGHLGETIRRFYREKDDAHEYEIYCFEPDLETFKKLDANVSQVKNVDMINACLGTEDGMVDFYRGRINQNEGGTTVTGKQTGAVDYKKPVKTENVDIARWMRANINEGDQVVLKMNIEGGEYALMEYMLKEDLTGLVGKCFIQLHAHKFGQGEQRQKFQQIEADFFNNAKCKCYFRNKGFYPFNVQ
jgi:FkbM family methyltransferase